MSSTVLVHERAKTIGPTVAVSERELKQQTRAPNGSRSMAHGWPFFTGALSELAGSLLGGTRRAAPDAPIDIPAAREGLGSDIPDVDPCHSTQPTGAALAQADGASRCRPCAAL
jgi:hypothetical protein